jgi:hypothetical protein
MDEPFDPDDLTLDANAVAAMMQEIFGSEMTAVPGKCANCGNVAEMGTLLAFTRGPGIVLRCSICHEVHVRIVRTPTATYVDATGVAFMRFPRTAPTPARSSG